MKNFVLGVIFTVAVFIVGAWPICCWDSRKSVAMFRGRSWNRV